MDNEYIFSEVTRVLATRFNVDRARLKRETRLAEDLGLDSFGGAELLFEVEDAFGIRIAIPSPPEMRTVDDVVAYVETLLKKDKLPAPSGEVS